MKIGQKLTKLKIGLKIGQKSKIRTKIDKIENWIEIQTKIEKIENWTNCVGLKKQMNSPLKKWEKAKN